VKQVKVYTSSYWYYVGGRGVQISNSKPDGIHVYKKVKELYPDWPMVSMWNCIKKKFPRYHQERIAAWEDFTRAYVEKLDSLGIERVRGLLEEGDVLLCWCFEDCHRHILAKWLNAHGIEAVELEREFAYD